MKKIALFVIIFVFFTGFLSAQSQVQNLTRVAVVDLNRILGHFNYNSRNQRHENNRQAAQTEINQQAAEIQELHEIREEAADQSNYEEVSRLDEEIADKTENLRNYAVEKNAELEIEKRALDDIFTNLTERMRTATRRYAIDEGIHIILERGVSGVIFHSGSVDITEQIIQIMSMPR